MFSAIAMIAFVGSSMANTAEIQDLESILPARDCMKEAKDAEDSAFASNRNYNASIAIGLGVLADCLESTRSTRMVKTVE